MRGISRNISREWIASLSIDRWLVIWLIIGIYLILGCLLESLSMLLLTIPVFFPIIASLGFDPVGSESSSYW